MPAGWKSRARGRGDLIAAAAGLFSRSGTARRPALLGSVLLDAVWLCLALFRSAFVLRT